MFGEGTYLHFLYVSVRAKVTDDCVCIIVTRCLAGHPPHVNRINVVSKMTAVTAESETNMNNNESNQFQLSRA